MEEKMLKDYTIKEFFEFFNQRSFEVKRMVDSLNEQKNYIVLAVQQKLFLILLVRQKKDNIVVIKKR